MTRHDISRRTVLRGGTGALALAGLAGLAGCASGTSSATAPEQITLVAKRQSVSVRSVPDLPAVVTGIDAFGGRLHRAGAAIDKNFTASPFSIAVAFAMLRAGARGTTGRVIDRTLGFPAGADPGVVHPALNALTSALITTGPVGSAPNPTKSHGLPPDPVVAIANGLFLDRGLIVQPAYLRLLATQYGASPLEVAFVRLDAATATINNWVSRQTRGRITKLFDRLDPATVLVLANAVYFKGDWVDSFDKSLTRDGAFTTPTKTVTASLMHQQFGDARYATGPGWRRLRLPYAGGELTMRIVLPEKVITDLSELAPAIAAATSSSARDSYVSIEATVPRWNTGSTLDLGTVLTSLGMGEVFTGGDFAGIAPMLQVSQAVHRANITVDEKGTEAAAVTGIDVTDSAGHIGADPFVVNRPFAWAIVHEPTGTPLFLGHVIDPTLD